jgi:hypothetical protein
MEETKTQTARDESDRPMIHRVCEGCNNMFATHADDPERRCPKCRKE